MRIIFLPTDFVALLLLPEFAAQQRVNGGNTNDNTPLAASATTTHSRDKWGGREELKNGRSQVMSDGLVKVGEFSG